MIINRQSKSLIAAIAVIFGGSLLFLAATTPITTTYAQSEVNQTSSGASQGTAEGNITTFNEQSKMPTNVEGCNALAAVMEGKAAPDHDLCDVIVYRQAPPIVRNDGMVMNNFSGIGHYIEMVPAVTNDTGQFASKDTAVAQKQDQNQSKNLKVAFGEFALIDPEVVPVQQIMQKYNWTQTALHHHLLNESPKILFLHWSVTGDANDLIKQAKEIIMQTATYQNLTGNTRTPTSAGP